jgi:hypothetical protein
MLIPLSTTFVHILRLNRLLSTTKFQVETPFWDSIPEARQVVVNQKENY